MIDFTEELSEEELIRLLKQDRLGAFREIYSRYWKKLFDEAYKRLRSRELAEEVVQELFTNLWTKRQVLQINTTIGAYLHSAIANHVIDIYRKELVRSRYKEAFKVVHTEVDNSTEDSIMLKDLVYTIDEEISHLPDKCRSVFELSRKEHKSNKEIASYLGISEKTVEQHLTRALKQIRLTLTHYLIFVLVLQATVMYSIGFRMPQINNPFINLFKSISPGSVIRR
ncbi:RNA polymerase sigma factor [Mucilaginibacter sp. SG564]|uniref:RNA polymerase sigma factor n=1 Tax=unclassified Mucilaginibacter TaxID=2617802 RepID=UPI0015579362|nr:RNA polymerase sigma-70 factor [Mucilaginibacter sp. SG564]NOW98511.1 RNA polymerase sigma-70 factor (ECF subfamily) [Mucilaginibacter sp. SG564]